MYMNNLFKRLTAAQFRILNIAIAAFSDLYIIIYLYLTFIDRAYFNKSLGFAFGLIKQGNPNLAGKMPVDMIDQLWGQYLLAFWGMILIYVFIHSVIFVLSLKQKKFATSYINFYSKSASFLMIIFAVFTGINLVNLGFLLLGILHIINFSGMKYFKRSEE